MSETAIDQGERAPRLRTCPIFVLFDLYDTLVGFDHSILSSDRKTISAELGIAPGELERAERVTMPLRMIGGCGHGLRAALIAILREAGAPTDPAPGTRFRELELAAWGPAAIAYDAAMPPL